MNIEDCIEIGKIIKTIGFKGEVTVLLHIPVSKKSFAEKIIFLKLNNRLVPFFIKYIRIVNNSATLAIDGKDTEKKVSEFLKTEIYLPAATLVLSAEKKAFGSELIGFSVNDKKLGNIGEIREVLDFPQQKILQIIHPNGKEILLPLIENFILKTNRKEKILEIEAPEGLVEMYLNPDSEKQN
ncbi:MAG: ribosome maturation factor RimM [Bacteroidia bacterium]